MNDNKRNNCKLQYRAPYSEENVRFLGKGSFGESSLVRIRQEADGPELLAVKKRTFQPEEGLREFVSSLLLSPDRVYGVDIREKLSYDVTIWQEYHPGDTTQILLSERWQRSPDLILIVMHLWSYLLEYLNRLRELDATHADIKLDNVVVDTDPQHLFPPFNIPINFWVIDLGLACRLIANQGESESMQVSERIPTTTSPCWGSVMSTRTLKIPTCHPVLGSLAPVAYRSVQGFRYQSEYHHRSKFTPRAQRLLLQDWERNNNDNGSQSSTQKPSPEELNALLVGRNDLYSAAILVYRVMAGGSFPFNWQELEIPMRLVNEGQATESVYVTIISKMTAQLMAQVTGGQFSPLSNRIHALGDRFNRSHPNSEFTLKEKDLMALTETLAMALNPNDQRGWVLTPAQVIDRAQNLSGRFREIMHFQASRIAPQEEEEEEEEEESASSSFVSQERKCENPGPGSLGLAIPESFRPRFVSISDALVSPSLPSEEQSIRPSSSSSISPNFASFSGLSSVTSSAAESGPKLLQHGRTKKRLPSISTNTLRSRQSSG